MTSRIWRPVLGLLAFLAAAHTSCPARAAGRNIKPGDTLKVTIGPAPITQGEDTLVSVNAGQELLALEVRGKWVKVSLEQNDEKLIGWIEALRVVPAAGTRPEATDSPSAQDEPGILPMGFYVTSSLGRSPTPSIRTAMGTCQISSYPLDRVVSPGKRDHTFVVVVICVSLPSQAFMPSDRDVQKMQRAWETRLVAKTRSNARVYAPDRFRIILSDGRAVRGSLAAVGGEFAKKHGLWTPQLPDGATDTVAVAFVVDEEHAAPPFRVQVDSRRPVGVPSKKQ